jgi:ABC-2 type transport system permease protein
MNELFKIIFSVFTGRGNDEEAWIDDLSERTPREAMLARVTRIAQWGAVVNGIIAVLVMLVVAGIPDSTQGVASIALGGYAGAPAEAIMIALLATVANTSALLLLAVATQAQELWAPVVAILLIVANVLGLLVHGFTLGIVAGIIGAVVLFYMVRDLRAFHGNPVARRELRGRMRGIRAFAIITVFLALMGTFTVLLYLLQLPSVTGSVTVVTGELGRLLFAGVVGVELLLTIFIVPALTAGAVTGERERKTYDLLQTTLLSAPGFLMGKMESALGYIFILLLSAIPLQSIAFLFGGISEVELIVAFTVLIVTGLLLGAMGLFFSAQTDRTLTATVRVYTTALALAIGIPVFSALVLGSPFGQVIEGVGLQGLSPTGEATAIYTDMVVSSLNPVTAAYYTQRILITQQSVFLVDVQLGSTGTTIPVVAPWVLMSLIYVGLTALLILMAIRRMRRARG